MQLSSLTCLLALLAALPAQAAQPRETSPARSETLQAEIFVVAVGISAGQLVAAQVMWMTPIMVNNCMGRTVQGCMRTDYEIKYNDYYKQAAAPKDDKKPAPASQAIPTQPLYEWITDEPRYGASARVLLRDIAKLPAVVAVLRSAPHDMSYQQSLEPIQVRNAIKASIYWENYSDGENFRVLSIMP